MWSFLESALSTVMIGCSIVGAATIGVFAGIAMERKNAKEMVAIQDEHIKTLQESVSIRDQAVELYKQEAEFYRGLYVGDAKPGSTLDG